ncbi:MAG: peptidoglycan-binding protein [Candidatus Solibacter sp.]|nr:peptidoglycan-binding protein [Candidatus Solibacter sp.]
MWKILSYTAMAAMMALAWSADGASVAQKKAPAKKAVAKKKASPAKKGSTAKKGAGTASSRKPGTTTKSGKKAPAKRVTWRNRQLSPSPDRYREIQTALAGKGFLKPEDATGAWNQASADALKKFQAEQNLESTGKINSLSLIALGLGPRRDPAPPAPPKPPGQPPGQ